MPFWYRKSLNFFTRKIVWTTHGKSCALFVKNGWDEKRKNKSLFAFKTNINLEALINFLLRIATLIQNRKSMKTFCSSNLQFSIQTLTLPKRMRSKCLYYKYMKAQLITSLRNTTKPYHLHTSHNGAKEFLNSYLNIRGVIAEIF